MSKTRHSITISGFPVNCEVYLHSYFGMFTTFKVIDRTSGKEVSLVKLVDFSNEELSSSEKKDAFNNRNCSHSYVDFSATVGLNSIQGLTVYTNTRNLDNNISFKRGSTLIGPTISIPGKSPVVSSDGSYLECIVSSPTYFEKKVYGLRGMLQHTYKATLLSRTYGTRITDSTKYVVREQYIYSEEFRRLNPTITDGERTRTYWDNPALLGVAGTVSPNDLILALKSELSLSETLVPHEMRDSFVDDVFDKFAIPDVNNIENLKDLREIRKSIPPIVNLLRKRSFKSLAEFYLWYKYTYSTTKLDLKAYYTFFLQWYKESSIQSNVKQSVIRYAHEVKDANSVSSSVTHYRIYSDNYNNGVLSLLGLDINLSNVWDTLPFSFVVDWFTNIGDVFARLDHSDVLSSIKIHSVLTSTKYIRTSYPLSQFGCWDPCKTVRYRRDIDSKLPVGNISFSLKNPASHITDGAALILANAKRK